MSDRRHDFLEAFCVRIGDEIERYFRPACCISATKMGIAVLEHFGIVAMPLPVSVVVFNAEISKQIVTTGLMPQPGGQGIVAVGRGRYWKGTANVSTWKGHLTLWLTRDRELIDPTLSQVNEHDPTMGVTGTRLSVRDAEDHEDGRVMVGKFWDQGGMLVGMCGKSLIVYTRMRGDETYKEHVDWGSSALTRSHTSNIIGTLQCMGFSAGEFGEKRRKRDEDLVAAVAMRVVGPITEWAERRGFDYHIGTQVRAVLANEPVLDSFRLVRALERDFLWTGDRELVAIFDGVNL